MRPCREGEAPHFRLDGKEWVAEPGDSMAEYNRLLKIGALKPLRWYQVEKACKVKPQPVESEVKQEGLF